MNKTAICNLALLRIGIAQQIASIDENSVQARACKAVYDLCVESMLRDRPWSFATRQIDLALVGSQQIADWYYSYRYPSGYVSIHRVLPVQSVDSTTVLAYTETDRLPSPQTYPFKIGSDAGGRLIHTNVSNAVAIGNVMIDDTSLYDPQFSSALAWYVAAEIALSLTKSRDIYTTAYGMYEQKASEAFASSGNEREPEQKDAEMIEARN